MTRANRTGATTAFRFVNHAAGIASAITVYLDSGNRARGLSAALYSDKHGRPAVRLVSASLKSLKGGAWNVMAIHRTRVAAGKAYWIAVRGTGGALKVRDLTGKRCGAGVSHQARMASMPGRWSHDAQSKGCLLSGFVSGLRTSPGVTSTPIVKGPLAPGGGSTASTGSTAPGSTSGGGSGTSGSGTSLTSPVLPPMNAAAPVVSGSPVDGETLTTSDGSWLDSPTSYSYQWEDCDSRGLLCTPIAGATANSYTLAASDAGSTIRSVVTASNAGGSVRAASAQTVVVTEPPAPSNTALPGIGGSAAQGSTLTTSDGSWNGNPTSYTYGWEDCNSSGASCTAISGATANNYTLTANDVGHTIRSQVIASNAGGSSSPATSAQTAVVSATAAPSNTALPTISGSAVQGSKLTTTKGSWNGSPTSYAYKWQDCDSSGASCTAISGATANNYTLTANDVGHTIRSVVTATNAGGSTPATSAQTTLVTAPVAPTNTAPPAVTGSSVQGDTLTTSNGTWNGSPTSYSYTWEDCDSSGANCTAISGATASTYTLAAGDVGDTIRSQVTATNAGGSSSPATSAQTAVITAGSGGGSHFQSVVFWLAYDGGTLSSLPWSGVTQVDLMSLASCVSAGNPDPDCSGPTSIDTEFNGVSNVSSFVSAVHAGGGQAIITIGGSTNPNWYYPCHGSNAAAFAQNLVNYMQSNGFDGIDLDIEQDTPTGNPQFTAADLQACAEDVYNDAKAITTQAGKTPIITADVDPTTDYDIGQIEQPYVDQFNAMSYNATGSTLASQIHELETQSGIPASKITEGVDIDDYPSTKSDCGPNASWASSNGLAGAMLWIGQDDAPTYTCLNAVAPYVH